MYQSSHIMGADFERDDNGKVWSRWEGGEIVIAEAYDLPS